jgi:hypothetical protein
MICSADHSLCAIVHFKSSVGALQLHDVRDGDLENEYGW